MKQGFSVLLMAINMVFALIAGMTSIKSAHAVPYRFVVNCEAHLTSGVMRRLGSKRYEFTTAYILVAANQGDGISENISEYDAFMSKLGEQGFTIFSREPIDDTHHYFRVLGTASAYQNILNSTPNILWVGLSKDKNTFARVQARRASTQQTSPPATTRFVVRFTKDTTISLAERRTQFHNLGVKIIDESAAPRMLLVECTENVAASIRELADVRLVAQEVQLGFPEPERPTPRN